MSLNLKIFLFGTDTQVSNAFEVYNLKLKLVLDLYHSKYKP